MPIIMELVNLALLVKISTLLLLTVKIVQHIAQHVIGGLAALLAKSYFNLSL